jgi:glutamate/tyrosine decarboxylase-like PLP-dependent enzyme
LAFWRNPHEKEVLDIMGKLLGIPNVSGYITSGGAEGNLAAIWWCKNNLLAKSKNQIQAIKQ